MRVAAVVMVSSNIGWSSDLTIAELASIARAIGFSGSFAGKTSVPDGMPRKLMGSSRPFRTGWTPKIPIERGNRETYHRVRHDAGAQDIPISCSEIIRASDLALFSPSLQGANGADASSPTYSLDIGVIGRPRVPGCARSGAEDRDVGRAIVRRPAVPPLAAA